MRIRDPGWRQFGSGIGDGKKSDPGSATLKKLILKINYQSLGRFDKLTIVLDGNVRGEGWGGGGLAQLSHRGGV
jgi:hypothetical protein